MTRPARFPAVIERALRWLLPATPAGRSVLGDLHEDFHQHTPGLRRHIRLATAAAQVAVAYLPIRLAGLVPHPSLPIGLGHDITSSWRSLNRNRGPAVLAVAALGLGLGSATAIIAVGHASLLRPLPFPDADALVVIGDRSAHMPVDEIAGNIPLPNFYDVVRESGALRSAAAYRDWSTTVSGPIAARSLRSQQVDDAFFEVLGVPFVLGRAFTPDDAGVNAVILSAALWQDAFGGDRTVVGRRLDLDGTAHTIVGVAAPITQLGNPMLWTPLRPSEVMLRRTARQVYGIGRLARGVSVTAAGRRMAETFDGIRRRHPAIGEDRAVGVMPIRAWIVGTSGPRLLALIAATVALVLLVACANGALLLIARTERRRAEFAVRAALGGGRRRLLRLLFVEALMITLAAAALGLLFAVWATRLLVQLYGRVLPRAWEIDLGPVAVSAALAAAFVAAAAIASLPARRLWRLGAGALTAGGRPERSRAPGQRVLIAAQTALAVVFLISGGLVAKSVWKLGQHDIGLDPRGAVVFDVGLGPLGRASAAFRPFVDQFIERLESSPGVAHVAAATRRPLMGGTNAGFDMPGARVDPKGALLEIRSVTPGYFPALGLHLRSGRLLTPTDSTSGSPVVVNATFERAFAPGGAVGRTITVNQRPYRIAGVVSDLREFGPDRPPRPTAYWPFGNEPYGGTTTLAIVARVISGSPMVAVGRARTILESMDPRIAIDEPITLEDLAASRMGRDRMAARTLLSLAAVMTVFLSSLGLYGVLSFAVDARTREIGIRRALGSPRRRIVKLFVAQGLACALPGVAAGLVAAFFTTQFVAAYLADVTPSDPATFAAAAALVTAVALMASWFPARRAARHDGSWTLLKN